MNTDIARKMNETKRFMWIKFRVQWSFLGKKEQGRGKEEKKNPNNFSFMEIVH